MRTRFKVAITTAALPVASLLVVMLPAGPAAAHGTMSDPPSRVYQCRFQESPENPRSDACKAAIAVAGTQPFYDWNEVNLLTAAGRHRELIPDGRLCSAGREKYRGLELLRTDWPAKRVSPGPLTITYRASAPHANSNFEFYITRQGWSPAQPLRWADLVHIQTFTNQNPAEFTNWTINLPQRTGRHLIYSIWQRVVGSEEAFYTCSDVDFGGATQPASTAAAPMLAPTTTSPTVTIRRQGAAWTAGTAYRSGDRVTYGGRTYMSRQAHTAVAGWEPSNAATLWR